MYANWTYSSIPYLEDAMRTEASRLPSRLKCLRNCTANHASTTTRSSIATIAAPPRTKSHDSNASSYKLSTSSNQTSTSHRIIQQQQRQRQPSQRSSTSAILALHPTQPLLKQMPQRPKPPPDEEFEEYFLKGSGPGGQKINKTNSAVQLLHKPSGIVVKSQATRSRSQNRTIARQLLADKLDNLEKGESSRAAIVGSVKAKKKASSAKKARRKYRKLEEEKAGELGEQREPRAKISASESSQQQVKEDQVP